MSPVALLTLALLESLRVSEEVWVPVFKQGPYGEATFEVGACALCGVCARARALVARRGGGSRVGYEMDETRPALDGSGMGFEMDGEMGYLWRRRMGGLDLEITCFTIEVAN